MPRKPARSALVGSPHLVKALREFATPLTEAEQQGFLELIRADSSNEGVQQRVALRQIWVKVCKSARRPVVHVVHDRPGGVSRAVLTIYDRRKTPVIVSWLSLVADYTHDEQRKEAAGNSASPTIALHVEGVELATARFAIDRPQARELWESFRTNCITLPEWRRELKLPALPKHKEIKPR